MTYKRIKLVWNIAVGVLSALVLGIAAFTEIMY